MPRFLVRVGDLEFTSTAASSSQAILDGLEHFNCAAGKLTVMRLHLKPAP
ncbi:hypothetical protein [Comamonas sediminis]|uniref:Uncharacterized protein n=1 Tax=Comamonas sediminis TaxID=1783360 RepID=A0ABV4B769_9BURK